MHLSDSSHKIFVAGHRGLVGSGVVRALRQAGFNNLILRARQELDLTDAAAVRAFYEAEKPDFVVVAAAKVGGILANDSYPADFLHTNLEIQSNVIHGAFEAGVGRLIFLGSTCIYPKLAPQPLKEEYLLTGPLEPTNQWYAIAKIAGVKLCEALRRQHGVDFVSMMPTNMYGPGDNFDLQSSHVLPALIRKFHEAKGTGEPVTLWGTGTPKREFMYVDDLASSILHVLRTPEETLYNAAPDGLINAGVGHDLSIAELAETIKRVVGADNPIEYDTTKPDGTPRKLVDVTRLFAMGWRPEVDLEEGIRRTYEWYLAQAG
ncbi:MAG: GDP-L-fucose synthase [Bacteroidetes bacterium]|jgi:GDP-L-fucose synthase|nr:GDP-L-fucose synthase [Bacteroidota bacterium]